MPSKTSSTLFSASLILLSIEVAAIVRGTLAEVISALFANPLPDFLVFVSPLDSIFSSLATPAFNNFSANFPLSTVQYGLIRTRHERLPFSHPITTPYLCLCSPVSNTRPVLPVTITSPLYLPTLISILVPVSVSVSSLLFGFLSLLMGLPKWTSCSSYKYLQIEGG